MKKVVAARRGAWALVVLSGLLIVGVGLERLLRPHEPHVVVDRDVYPVVGVDISAHNGAPDFDSVAGSGVDFVYLKASEGSSFRDPAFIRNYVAARRTPLAVGAYHFFRFDSDGVSQADNMLNALKGLKVDLPLAIDVEEWQNAATVPTDLVVERLETMLSRLRDAGHRVIVYTNKSGHSRFMRELEADLWICSFTTPPIGRTDWRLWQHSHRSRIPGVDGPVDMDTFNGSREEWQAWLAGN